jgi:tetratricopeptide (TPR) repeat protein
MKTRIALGIYYIGIVLLVACSILIVFKLLYFPPCVPTKTIDCSNVIDGWSVAGLAATVLGVAATVLAFLGALAVAAWWTDLENRVGKKVDELFQKQLVIVNDQVEKSKQEVIDLQNKLVQDGEDTNRAISYLILGNQLLEHKRSDQAIALYLKALALRPRDPQINFALGQAYMNNGFYEKAISCFRVAIEEEQEFGQAYKQLGLAIRFQADKAYENNQDEDQHETAYNEAIGFLKRASELLPDSDEAFASLGGTYRRLKNYSRSLTFYKKAIEVNPQSSYALGNVGSLSWYIGDLKTAQEAFRQVETLATAHIEARSNDEIYWDYYDRGQARLILQQKESALQDYRDAISLTRTPGEFQSAIDVLKFLLEVKDKHPIDGLEDALRMLENAQTSLQSERNHV